MSTTAPIRWHSLEASTREELDRRFIAELSQWDETTLTDEGVRVYLDLRHERPFDAVTTYEEGRIKRILRKLPHAVAPDPVESEEHRDWLERFGARTLHATSDQTYVIVMVSLTFAFLIALGIVGLARWL